MESIELLAKAVKDSYRDGMPLHVHPTAKAESVFHIVTKDEFEELSDREVQNILRRRHLVIHERPSRKTITFKQALMTLGGGIKRAVDIQGNVPYSIADPSS